MQVKKQQLELDMEQQTGSKLEKEYIKAVHCHPVTLSQPHPTSTTSHQHPVQPALRFLPLESVLQIPLS